MKTHQFTLNGTQHSLTDAEARARIVGQAPEPVQTHWVEIEGTRWPAKQALSAALGVPRNSFISHKAVRILASLGFETSPLPHEQARQKETAIPEPRPSHAASPSITAQDAIDAFTALDRLLQAAPLTATISQLEGALEGADQTSARRIAHVSQLDAAAVRAAVTIRKRVGVLDSLIHAGVITQLVAQILEPGETITQRPSLGAGNDRNRHYDLETNLRIAEFKVAQWKGADSMRQRGLVADLVGLCMDGSGRRRQLFVVGPRPQKFLTTSKRDVAQLIQKSALRVRGTGILRDDITVAELTRESGVELMDLLDWFPELG